MDPYTVMSAASLGYSALNSLFGPDPDEEAERTRQQNELMIQRRMREVRRILGTVGERFGEQMELLNPRLAFADTQGRQAARAGAKAAQASLRRRLGSGGDIFAAALESGARTVATDRQNTLRALATTEARRAAMAEAAQEAGFQANMPFAFASPATGARNARISALFAGAGTALAYIGANRTNKKGESGGVGDSEAVTAPNNAAVNTDVQAKDEAEYDPMWGIAYA